MRSYLEKLTMIAGSFRMSTRIWYDVIAPTTMLILVKDSFTSLATYTMTLGALVSFHAGHTYFNDMCDAEVDRQSSEPGRHQRALVLGKISRRELAYAGWLFLGLSILFVLNLPWLCVLAAAIALPLVLAYNFRPVQLSARPLVTQVFWPVTWMLMFFFCVAAVGSESWVRALPYLVFVVLFMGLGESIAQDVRDADNDAGGGRRTTVVEYGVPRTTVFAWVFQGLSLLAWLWFILTYPLPKLSGMLSSVVIIVWLLYFFRLTCSLQGAYDKMHARRTHIGSIVTFTSVNLITIGGIMFGI